MRRCSDLLPLPDRCDSARATCKTGQFLKHSLAILLSGLENH
nr:MAG TPA: hypothetical protein [Caudoviricetes sp.]